MRLHEVAPSITPLSNTDRAPADYPDPKFRLTVLLGAGASIYAKAASTSELTSLAARRSVSGKILEALRASSAIGPQANFEDVLQALEELDAFQTSSARAPSVVRPFLKMGLAGIVDDPIHLRIERLELLEDIAAAFDSIDYDTMWRPLYRLLRPHLDDFDFDVFTLNYDILADVTTYALSMLSGKKWFDGFGPPAKMSGDGLGFRPDLYANQPPWEQQRHLTLAHLHGSVGYAYHLSDPRMAHAVPFELVLTYDVQKARQTWRWARSEASKNPRLDFGGITPIVSGLRKLEKLNVQPYANYFSGFAHAVSKSPYLMIVGYGAGDEHINYWLRAFTLIHGEMARVVEITHASDPSRFAIQKFGAYDLRWSELSGFDNAFINDAGVHCLTLTGGLTMDRELSARLINAQFSGKLRSPTKM